MSLDTDRGWTLPDGGSDEPRMTALLAVRTAAHWAEIERYVGEVEPLLRRTASVELDGRGRWEYWLTSSNVCLPRHPERLPPAPLDGTRGVSHA
ncbi:hypothetical protein [Polymorphospora sp. NPDC050346]|uniref:hypothetical protein n=1 Tax=Polymorphospora sp. NPDC050346 TaxID=3155780 RepID=UPI003405E2F0